MSGEAFVAKFLCETKFGDLEHLIIMPQKGVGKWDRQKGNQKRGKRLPKSDRKQKKVTKK